MIFLAPQRPHAALDAFLGAAPAVRSFAPDTGAQAAISAGEVVTLPAQPSRFALWLRTGEAARVLAANPAADFPAPVSVNNGIVTIAIVGGNSGVARLDDEAMPQSLPLPHGIVADDLVLAINGTDLVAGNPVQLEPLDVTTLPEAKPTPVNTNWQDFNGVGAWRVWKDGDEIKIDGRTDNTRETFKIIYLSIQITEARYNAIIAAAALRPLTWGGAEVPNNAPLHREGDALLAIFPPNAEFTLTFEGDTSIRNLVYSAVLGELEDYPAVSGALVRRESVSQGLTGLVHLRTIQNPRLSLEVALTNHAVDLDALLLSHIAALDGVGVLPFGLFASDRTNASWARPEVCRFVEVTRFAGWTGWGGVNDSGATGKMRFQEVAEHTREAPPFVPPVTSDYLLLEDGCKILLEDGAGFIALAA